MPSSAESSTSNALDALTSSEIFLITTLILFSLSFVLSGIIIQIISSVCTNLVERIFRPFERSGLLAPDGRNFLLPPSSSKADDTSTALLRRSMELDERCPIVAHTPKEFPTKTTTGVRMISLRNNGSPCVICLENIVLGDLKRNLPCGHEYHARCVDKWLVGVSNSCPCCCEPVLRGEHPGSYNSEQNSAPMQPILVEIPGHSDTRTSTRPQQQAFYMV